MVKFLKQFGVILCFMVLFGSIWATTMVRPPQRRNELSNTEEAVRYLKELDDFYSNAARPRFGKRTSLLQYLKDWAQEQVETEEYQKQYSAQT